MLAGQSISFLSFSSFSFPWEVVGLQSLIFIAEIVHKPGYEPPICPISPATLTSQYYYQIYQPSSDQTILNTFLINHTQIVP